MSNDLTPMHRFFRNVAAILLILSCVFSERMVFCMCDAVAHQTQTCDGHEHHAQPQEEEHSCPCPGCHVSCSHTAFVIEEVILPATPEQSQELLPDYSLARPQTGTAEIFIPPKLHA